MLTTKSRPVMTATPLQQMALAARSVQTVRVIKKKVQAAAPIAPTKAVAAAPIKTPKPPWVRPPSPEALVIRHRTHQTRCELANRFPACFMPHGEPKKPLAIGIDVQLYDACSYIDRHDLINALTDYTSGNSYLCASVAGAERIDLNGTAIGAVTLLSEAWAKAQLKRLERGECLT